MASRSRLRPSGQHDLKILRYIVLLLLVCAAALSCFAQASPPVAAPAGTTPTARSIEGTVLDVNGAPVPDAVVLLKDLKTLQVRSFIAQKDGKYHFYGLSTDINYQVRAQSKDMTSPIKSVSVFDSHKRIIVNLKLKKKKKKDEYA